MLASVKTWNFPEPTPVVEAPGVETHCTTLPEVHEVVVHSVLSSATVRVGAMFPKFTPMIVIVPPRVVGAFEGEDCEITGESYVNTAVAVAKLLAACIAKGVAIG